MGIAIKKLEPSDIAAFEEFLKTERRELPELMLAPLASPHEDIAVIACKQEKYDLELFAEEHQFVLTAHHGNIMSLSKREPVRSTDHSRCIFSGYAFYNNKMLIGMDEVVSNTNDIRDLYEACGEFSICLIGGGCIKCSSDFFGMVPWFYFEDKCVFAASNNYHLMLTLLAEMHIELSMNIPRSRVNMITSGFMYGTVFSKELDVNGCKINLAYEEVNFSPIHGTYLTQTSLRDVLTSREKWDDDRYEHYIIKAKSEIESNCRAALEHNSFNKVIIDISGGFDSRIVFAAACGLPRKLRSKIHTFTRKSGTQDDVEKASAVTNLYQYPKYSYSKIDISELFDTSGRVNLAQVSRTLGLFSVNSHLYMSRYSDHKTLEITGYLGEVILGFMRCRGELDYSLGDKRLLARLGGCYLHNSVDELKDIFHDQEIIINKMLSNYSGCDCLFKKFQQLYIDSRNRFICGSSHNIEHDNLRIPMLFSKYALKAKWMYFNRFNNNEVPDEKISVDLLTAINPLLAALPFASNNDNVIPQQSNLLNPVHVEIKPDNTIYPPPKRQLPIHIYTDKVIEYMDNIEIAEKMLLHIYDYSPLYYPVCLGLYKVLSIFREDPSELKTVHGRETIRKIYDTYYQIRLVEKAKNDSHP